MQNQPPSDLEALRKEIELLRAELNQLKQFIRVTPSNPQKGIAASAQVRCSSLAFVSRAAKPQLQAVIGTSPSGAQIALIDSESKKRVNLSARQLTFFTENGEPAAEVGIESGRGRVLVSEEGNPRAVLKATSTGGCVSVLHDDGKPRASLLSTNHAGADLLLINPDLKPGVRLSSGAPNGGLISVHRNNGRPAVTLHCGQKAAGISIRKSDGSSTSIT